MHVSKESCGMYGSKDTHDMVCSSVTWVRTSRVTQYSKMVKQVLLLLFYSTLNAHITIFYCDYFKEIPFLLAFLLLKNPS